MEKLTINGEECRQIISFERYHISESGRIYRTEVGKACSWRTKEKVYIRESKIHFRVCNNNIRQGQASLTDSEGKLHNLTVAPLIAIAFDIISDKLRKKETIAYKDGNKRNLHYSNLFVTAKEYTNGKLKQEDVKHIKKQIKEGVPLSTIARLFNVSEMQISRIKTGENWGNGKRKIKAPKAPFEIENAKIRRHVATFDKKRIPEKIKKRFIIKRNLENPTDNVIWGIINGYKLSLKHTNITRATKVAEKLNEYFFDNREGKIHFLTKAHT